MLCKHPRKSKRYFCCKPEVGARYGRSVIHVLSVSCSSVVPLLCLRLLMSSVRLLAIMTLSWPPLRGWFVTRSWRYVAVWQWLQIIGERCFRWLKWYCCRSLRISIDVFCDHGLKISAECCWPESDFCNHKDWTEWRIFQRRVQGWRRSYQRSGGLYCSPLTWKWLWVSYTKYWMWNISISVQHISISISTSVQHINISVQACRTNRSQYQNTSYSFNSLSDRSV